MIARRLNALMTILGLAVAAVLWGTGPAWAVCASLVGQTETFVAMQVGGDPLNVRTVLYADLDPGGPRQQAAQLEGVLQAGVDFRLALTSLPLDDPDRSTDPDRVDLFWSRADGVRGDVLERDTLTSRCAVIAVEVAPEAVGGFSISIANP